MSVPPSPAERPARHEKPDRMGIALVSLVLVAVIVAVLVLAF